MPATRGLIFGALILLASSTVFAADSINEKVVAYLKSKVGTRLGGGECAQAVSEALRVSGAAFALTDLGEDNPEPGDYVWGTLLKVISYTDGEVVDSEPATKVLPGDVLQFHQCRFVYVTENAKGTNKRTHFAIQHTAVAAKIDDAGQFPTEVYEQNVASANTSDGRVVVLNPLDVPKLTAGWIRIYRPKARVDKRGKYQFSIVNNMPDDQTVIVKFSGMPVSELSLTAADTAASYAVPFLNSNSSSMKFTIAPSKGAAISISNASGYEIYPGSDGAPAIRKVAN